MGAKDSGVACINLSYLVSNDSATDDNDDDDDAVGANVPSRRRIKRCTLIVVAGVNDTGSGG